MPVSENDAQRLHDAAFNGNWNDVEDLLETNDPCELLNMRLTDKGGETALHIATCGNQKNFVEKLVKKLVDTHLSKENLALQTTTGDTALCLAAKLGFMDIAQIMIGTKCIYVSDLHQSLLGAVQCGCKEMAMHLFQDTKKMPLEEAYCNRLFVATVMRGMYDMALKILKKYQNVPLHRDDTHPTALHVLVKNPQSIFNESGVRTAIRHIWSWICGQACKSTVAYQLLKMIWDRYLKLERLEKERFVQLTYADPNVFFEAVKFGNVKFVTLVVDTFLMRKAKKDDKQLLHEAISHRQEKVFNQIYRVAALKVYGTSFTDAKGNNMLHLAGKLPTVKNLDTPRPNETVENLDPPPPNLQLQPELFWFKEMQKIMPRHTKMKNKENLTPEEVFLKEHEDLIITDRTAMNGKANSYLVTSTVICTIVFAAALIIPGSTTTKGPPETVIFHKDTWFKIFIVSNVVAWNSSITSLVISQLIQTSGFVERKYSTVLRAKMWGGTALRISMASVVIAFMAAVFLMFDLKAAWVPYFTVSLALVPVISFLLLYYYL